VSRPGRSYFAVESHDTEEAWPPKRPCTDCNLLRGAANHSEPVPPNEATFVMTHLSGMQWFACDAHAKNPIGDRGLVQTPEPVADFWERVRAHDAEARLRGTWRPE
jgi:hypothetical protein